MKYLNLPVSAAQDERIMRSTHEQIGVWFLLLSYCHAQMNGGVIKNCRDWPDDLWMKAAGVKASLVNEESPLWHFSGMLGLVVYLYDSEAEEAYRKRQKLGRIYVQRRWQAEREKKIIRLSSKSSTEQKAKSS